MKTCYLNTVPIKYNRNLDNYLFVPYMFFPMLDRQNVEMMRNSTFLYLKIKKWKCNVSAIKFVSVFLLTSWGCTFVVTTCLPAGQMNCNIKDG